MGRDIGMKHYFNLFFTKLKTVLNYLLIKVRIQSMKNMYIQEEHNKVRGVINMHQFTYSWITINMTSKNQSRQLLREGEINLQHY